MKKYIIILLLVSVIQTYGQNKAIYTPNITNVNDKDLLGPVQLSDKKELEKVLQFIMQYYAESFIYYDNINRGEYEFREVQGQWYIHILGLGTDAVIDKIELTREKENNGTTSIIFNHNDLLHNYVDKAKFEKRQKMFDVRNGVGIGVVSTPGILIDREILNFDADHNYGKILSRKMTELPVLFLQTKLTELLFHIIEVKAVKC